MKVERLGWKKRMLLVNKQKSIKLISTERRIVFYYALKLCSRSTFSYLLLFLSLTLAGLRYVAAFILVSGSCEIDIIETVARAIEAQIFGE